MKIEFNFPDSVPLDQIDIPFIQGMLDRMAIGFYNYGPMRCYDNIPNSLKNVLIRLIKYAGFFTVKSMIDSLHSEMKPDDLIGSRNTESLMDASNYCMMEFVRPFFHNAFFKPTTKEESPGAIVGGKLVKGKEDYISSRRIKREGD